MKKIIVSIFAFIAIALTGNLFSQAAYLDKPEEFDPTKPCKIMVEGGNQLLHGKLSGVKYNMFDCRDGVYQVGDANENNAVTGIIFCTSPGVIPGTLNTLFKGQ